MITVMGATGHTGARIAASLLEAGKKIRVLGRSMHRLAEFRTAGAEVLAGDASDVHFLARAFRGADAVYTLLPTDRSAPDYRAEQDRQGEAITSALGESGVRYVVALSSLGAELCERTGVIEGLHAQEERLKRLNNTNVLLLRPVTFFENFNDALHLVEREGIIADSVRSDLAIPMVATRDIADVAARSLQVLDWSGIIARELLGPRDLSYEEATRIIGERMDRPDLPYIQLSYAAMAAALVEAGLSRSFAELYVEMTRAFNEGRVRPHGAQGRESITPTRFEEFADDLVRAHPAAEASGGGAARD